MIKGSKAKKGCTKGNNFFFLGGGREKRQQEMRLKFIKETIAHCGKYDISVQNLKNSEKIIVGKNSVAENMSCPQIFLKFFSIFRKVQFCNSVSLFLL